MCEQEAAEVAVKGHDVTFSSKHSVNLGPLSVSITPLPPLEALPVPLAAEAQGAELTSKLKQIPTPDGASSNAAALFR